MGMLQDGNDRYRNTQLTDTWFGNVIPDRSPKVGSLRLVTFNINGLRGKLIKEQVYWIKFFRDFDILGLQELKASEPEARESLERLWGYEFFIHARDGGRYGVAVLLKSSIAGGARLTHKDFILLDRFVHGSETLCRSITVSVPALQLVIVCVHRKYGDGGAWNKKFLAHVESLLQEGKGRHVVVMGDLNCWPGEGSAAGVDILVGMEELGLLDCTHATSEWLQPSHFPASKYSFHRLDYILLSQSLRGSSALVPGSGRVLSNGACWGDHVPVECTLYRSKLKRK